MLKVDNEDLVVGKYYLLEEGIVFKLKFRHKQMISTITGDISILFELTKLHRILWGVD